MTLLNSSRARYKEPAKLAAQVPGTLRPPSSGFWAKQFAEYVKIRDVKMYSSSRIIFKDTVSVPTLDRQEQHGVNAVAQLCLRARIQSWSVGGEGLVPHL